MFEFYSQSTEESLKIQHLAAISRELHIKSDSELLKMAQIVTER